MALNTTNNQNQTQPNYDPNEEMERQRRAKEQQDKERQNTLYVNDKGKNVTNPKTGKPYTQLEWDNAMGNKLNLINQKKEKLKKQYQVQATGRGPDMNTNKWQYGTPWQNSKDIAKMMLEEEGIELSEDEIKKLEEEFADEFNPTKDPDTGVPSVPNYLNDPSKAKEKAKESVEELPSPPSTPSVLGEQTDIDVSKSLWGNQKKPVDTSAFPRSIWQAWKNGEFGTWVNEDGTIDEEAKKNAEQIRNNLMLNSVLTAIGNVSRGAYQGLTGQDIGGHKDSLWQERQAENIRKQTDRENTQRDVIMDTQTKELLTNRWNSYTPEQKQGMLDAYNAYTSGSLSKAEDLMRNSMGDKEYSEWLQYFENLKAQLQVNADARAQEQLRYMETMGPLGLLLGAVGKFIPGI